MGVRVKRGQWPDVAGDYQIADTDGCHLFYVLGGSFGPDTEAVAERILVAINGDTVPAPTLPEDVGELVRLKSWKAEATEVIAGWERVWDAMGRPGRLGRPKSEGCLEALVAASPVPDLPSWVSMHEMATGADLIEHDPNGEVWERWLNGENWWADHADTAAPTWLYLVRRRPVPVEPTTERVGLHELAGRRLPGRDWLVNQFIRKADGAYEAINNRHGMGVLAGTSDLMQRATFDVDPDGMVTVLREDGAS